jgi:hypothetical protein
MAKNGCFLLLLGTLSRQGAFGTSIGLLVSPKAQGHSDFYYGSEQTIIQRPAPLMYLSRSFTTTFSLENQPGSRRILAVWKRNDF